VQHCYFTCSINSCRCLNLAVRVRLDVDSVHFDQTITGQKTCSFRRRVVIYVADELTQWNGAGVHGEPVTTATTATSGTVQSEVTQTQSMETVLRYRASRYCTQYAHTTDMYITESGPIYSEFLSFRHVAASDISLFFTIPSPMCSADCGTFAIK